MAAAGADATFCAHLSWRQYCQTPLCSTLRKCAPPQGFMPRPPFLPQKACGAARKAQYFHRPQPPAASPLCKAFFPVRRGKSCRPAGKCVAEARPSPRAATSRLPKFYAELRRGVLPRAPWQVRKENTVQTSTPFFVRSRRPRSRDRRDSLLMDDAIRRAFQRHR